MVSEYQTPYLFTVTPPAACRRSLFARSCRASRACLPPLAARGGASSPGGRTWLRPSGSCPRRYRLVRVRVRVRVTLTLSLSLGLSLSLSLTCRGEEGLALRTRGRLVRVRVRVRDRVRVGVRVRVRIRVRVRVRVRVRDRVRGRLHHRSLPLVAHHLVKHLG